MTTLTRRSGSRVQAAVSSRRRVAQRDGSSLIGRLREFTRGMSQAPRRADVLRGIVDAISTTRVPERMAENIAGLVTTWFGGEAWAVLAADETDGLRWLADRGVPRARRAAVAGVAGRAVKDGTIVSDRVAGSTSVLIAIPMKSHGRAMGALVGVDDSAPQAEAALTGAPVAELLVLTGAIGGPLDTALRLKRATALSAIDDLTGLYNSRFLDGALRREVKRSVRTGRPLSMLFVDLDGFKGINDRYGHLCGSRALVEAAGRILSGARETDVVARFGGDEFALILPDTGREGAMLVARRVRERVSSVPFLAGEGIGYRLTASVGAATLAEAGTPESLLAAADTAMYRVKGRGKDGIEMADVVPPSKQS